MNRRFAAFAICVALNECLDLHFSLSDAGSLIPVSMPASFQRALAWSTRISRLTMRLSDAGLRCRQMKLIYPNHRLPPWPNENATRDRSNRMLDGRQA